MYSDKNSYVSISEFSEEDLKLNLELLSKYSHIKLNTVLPQDVDKSLTNLSNMIVDNAEFPSVYRTIYRNIKSTFKDTNIQPGTIGSFIWGSMMNDKIRYKKNCDGVLEKYVKHFMTPSDRIVGEQKNVSVCSLLSAGSVQPDNKRFSSIPILLKSGDSLIPLVEKQSNSSLSGRMFGLTPRTFENTKSTRTIPVDTCILYVKISKKDEGITSLENNNKVYNNVVISKDDLKQLNEYGCKNIELFLYEELPYKVYDVYYAGKFDIFMKDILKLDTDSLVVDKAVVNKVVVKDLVEPKTNTAKSMTDNIKYTMYKVLIFIVIAAIVVYLAKKYVDKKFK